MINTWKGTGMQTNLGRKKRSWDNTIKYVCLIFLFYDVFFLRLMGYFVNTCIILLEISTFGKAYIRFIIIKSPMTVFAISQQQSKR